MTILLSTPTFIVCGSLGVIHRVKGWRLPSACVPFVGVAYEDVPTDVLERYWRWLGGYDHWLGHVHEMWAIEDVLEGRNRGEEDTGRDADQRAADAWFGGEPH